MKFDKLLYYNETYDNIKKALMATRPAYDCMQDANDDYYTTSITETQDKLIEILNDLEQTKNTLKRKD